MPDLFPKEKPCTKEECLAAAREFEAALREPDEPGEPPYDVPPMEKFHNCGRCGNLCCGYHSTGSVHWTDEHGEKQKVSYNPAICIRCTWLADNNGEHGREPGWVASRSEIPW